MRTISVIRKSLKEQLRSYWVLLLSLSMGPFFIFVYFLIMETSEPKYTLLMVNNDKGLSADSYTINYGDSLISFFNSIKNDTIEIPLIIQQSDDWIASVSALKNKKADALIVIDDSFTQRLQKKKSNDTHYTEHKAHCWLIISYIQMLFFISVWNLVPVTQLYKNTHLIQ